jgi:predicted transcriptional regulator
LRRNKLSIEKEILGTLIFNGPLKLTNIACVVRTNCKKMKNMLEELNREGLVIQKNISKDDLYLITSKGLEIYRKTEKQIDIKQRVHLDSIC